MGNAGMTREQKWSVVILSFGTFLEYFDLMLYVHMSTLLNELFFPKTDPTVAQLLAATAFCTTYLLRPIGGLFIGWIGDKWGRKFTITLTTFIAAAACFIMVFTPEYKEKGIIATAMIIVARMLQGFSSLGEIMSVYLYTSEIFKVPYRCIAAGIMGLSSQIGGLFAVITASIVLSSSFSWRYAFVFGAFIAVIGVFARLRLRETPEFVNYQKRIAKQAKENKQEVVENKTLDNEKVDKKAILAFAFTEFHRPICFYVAIVYLRDFMENLLKMTHAQTTTHNLKVIILEVIMCLFIVYLVKKIHPVKIAMVTALVFVIVLPFMPHWIYVLADIGNNSIIFPLLCLQCLILLFSHSTLGTLDAIQYKYFPIGKRFTRIATTFGIANPLGYAFVGFSLIPLTHYFGYYALWIIFTPAVIGYVWALFYFRKLEIERGLYYDYPCEEKPAFEDTATDEVSYDYFLPKEYEPFKDRCEYSAQLLNELEMLNKEAKRKVNLKLVKKAIVFAKKWHGTQVRKTGELFHSHPLTVAELTSKYYFKTDVLVACILHDTVEDSDCTVELIEKEFNTRIAKMVDGLTKYQVIDGEEKKLTLEDTLRRLYKAKDYEGLFIKCMDREHNMQTIEGMKSEKQRKIAVETTNIMLPAITNMCEKLGIDDYRKYELEDKIFKLTNKILGEKKKNSMVER